MSELKNGRHFFNVLKNIYFKTSTNFITNGENDTGLLMENYEIDEYH